MIRPEEVKDYIQLLLQNLIYDNGFEIEVAGEVDVYNHEWVKERFGIRITPFCLTPISTDILNDGLNTSVDNFALAIMPFSHDREKFEVLRNSIIEFMSSGQTISLGNNTITFKFLGYDTGADFAEGSGFAKKRFELVIDFQVTSTENLLNSNDVVITFGSQQIPVQSFKITHGKTNFINVLNSTNGTADSNNPNLFRNEVVVQAYLKKDNIVMDLISRKTQTNISRLLNITVSDVVLINENYTFDGFEFSDEKVDILKVFLYFTKTETQSIIKINGLIIPIIDFSMSVESLTEQVSKGRLNIVKNIYLGLVRAFSFIISETELEENQGLIEVLRKIALSDSPQDMMFDVEIPFLGETFTKRLLFGGMTKEMKTGARNTNVLKFIEGVDL